MMTPDSAAGSKIKIKGQCDIDWSDGVDLPAVVSG